MKLSVLCSDERLDKLPQLRDVLDNLFIEYLAWFPRADTELPDSMDNLDRCLEYSKYLLCLPSEKDVASAWLHYALGYQRGRTDRIAFWVDPLNRRAVPAWAARYIIITGDKKDVYEYYAEVEETWSEEAKAEFARREISAMNLEVSPRAFVEAVQEGERRIVGLFLEAGFSAALRDASGVPVLNHAIRSGHTEIVTPLLEAGADLNGVADDRGTTPLMDAAAAGLEEMTAALVELGADLEHSSRDGQTAVTLAVGNGRDRSAVTLIRAGADVDAKDMLGMSARKYARLYSQQEILDAISEKEQTQ